VALGVRSPAGFEAILLTEVGVLLPVVGETPTTGFRIIKEWKRIFNLRKRSLFLNAIV